MYVSMKQPFKQEVTMVWFSRSMFTLPPNADVFRLLYMTPGYVVENLYPGSFMCTYL